MSMKAVLRKIQAATRMLVSAVQKVVLTVTLFLVYVFGFALTIPLVLIFDRPLARRKPADLPTYWEDARGYEPDYEKSLRQS